MAPAYSEVGINPSHPTLPILRGRYQPFPCKKRQKASKKGSKREEKLD
jgi:hypothetical protein